MNDAPAVFLTAAEVAQQLNLSATTVLRLPLPRYTFGPRAVRFHIHDIQAFVNSRRSEPANIHQPPPIKIDLGGPQAPKPPAGGGDVIDITARLRALRQ